MKLRLALTFAALFAGTNCSPIYTLDYVGRVLRYQDANTDDYLWKRSIDVPASMTPRPLARAPDLTFERIIEQHLPDGERVDAFMTRTGARSLLVIRGNAIAYERYANGGAADERDPVFSVSKSITTLILARAIERGEIEGLDTPVTRYIPELRERDSRFDAITLAHLVDMRSGLRFEDDTGFPFVNGDAPLVYYASDMREVVQRETRIISNPGDFHYNDYNPNLLALALERAVGPARLSVMRNELWAELGAEDGAAWQTDNHGFPYWESGFVATPRDLAKLGVAVLAASLGEASIMPRAWFERTSNYTPHQRLDDYDGRQWSYRGGWWLVLRPDGGHDIAAIGRFGQFIYVSPRSSLVIVRTGTDQNAPEDGELAQLFYAVASEVSAGTAVN